MASKAVINQFVQAGGDPKSLSEDDDDLEVLMKTKKLRGGKDVTSVVTPLKFMDTLSNAEQTAADYITKGAPESAFDPSTADPKHGAGTLSDDDLDEYLTARPNSPGAKEEKRLRDLVDSRNFLQNISDPETAPYVTGRLAAQGATSLLSTLDPQTMGPGLYGMVGQLPELIPGVDIGADEAMEFAADRQANIGKAMGVGAPRNVSESVASVAGMLVPMPGPAKMQGGMAVLEAMTPFVFGPTVPKVATNLAVGLGIEQGVRELTDSEDSDYQTLFDLAGKPDATAEEQAEQMPLVQAGMSVGIPLIASMPIVAPLTKAAWTATKPVSPKIVEINKIDPAGPENLASLETTGDQYIAYVADDKQALINIAKRAGVPDPDHLEANIDLNTQMSGLMKVNEGINSGKMRGQYGDFVSPVAPRIIYNAFKELPPDVQKEYDLYLKLGDYADDLRAQINDPKGPKGAQGQLTQVQAQRAALRAKYPLLTQFSQQYQQVIEASREFLQQGPYALIGRNQAQQLAAGRKHFVPSSTTGIDPSDPMLTRVRQAQRGSGAPTGEHPWLGRPDHNKVKGVNDRRHSMEVMIEYTRGTLNQQLQNNVRAAYVDSMLSSAEQAARVRGNKSPLIRKATGEEVQKYPERIIKVVRQGKTTNYITGQLQAQIARFDPYMPQGILGNALVTSRRWFEHGTTGVASITFAPTTMIRDTLAGIANAGKGEKGPGITSVVTAPLEILSARATEAFVQGAQARLLAGKSPIPFMDPQGAQQFVQRAATSLQNSLYTLAKEQGGYDASIMRTRIKVATGAFHEIARTIEEKAPWLGKTYGYSAGALFKGFGALFDSMQEAPRYSAFKRGLAAGHSPEDAVRTARRITGDTNRSGRVYDQRGKRIVADAVNPEYQLADQVAGGAIEMLRLGAPYFNPAVQGIRRAFGAAADDPIRFAARSWLTVGIPSVVAYGWNQLLTRENPEGHDYAQYQFEQRSMRDQIMEPIYLGIPGLPPEQGIAIPIAHEQVLFAAPYLQMIHHLGSSDEHTNVAATQFGMTLLQNSVPLSPPPLMNAAFAASGINPPQIGASAYDIQEDNVGFLPQNVEMTIRELFGNASAYALDGAYAFVEDGPGAAAQEVGEDVLSRLPVVKGPAGLKRKSTYFTPLAAEQRQKLDAYYQFEKEYDTHYRKDGVLLSTQDFPEGPTGVTMDTPLAGVGPVPTPKPVNPVYAMFGDYIRDSFETNNYGMKNIRSRQGALTDQLALLRGYNRGRQKDFDAYQSLLATAKDGYEAAKAAVVSAKEEYEVVKKEARKAQIPVGEMPGGPELKAKVEEAEAEQFKLEQMMKASALIEDNELDISDRFDVEKLINLLETERHATMSQQLSIIEKIEDDVTDRMIAAGLLQPGQEFAMEKHLKPMEVSPP